MAKGQFYVDQALTNLSQAWTNDSADFISRMIFPTLVVEKKTGKYWAYNKDNLRIPSSTLRSGKAMTQEATYGKSLSDFGPLQEHALKDFITKDEYDMTDTPLNVESDLVAFLNEQMAIAEEADLASTLSNTSIITNYTTKSGTGQWSDYANSNPFADITTAVTTARAAMIKVPNTIIFSWEVWIQLINHPDMLERIKYTGNGGVMSTDVLLRLLAPYGITQVLVGKVMKNSAAEGQTDVLASVWGKHCWLAYVTPTPSLRAVNGGYTLQLANGKYVDRQDLFDPKGTEIRNNDYYDQMLFSSDCFYLIENAVA